MKIVPWRNAEMAMKKPSEPPTDWLSITIASSIVFLAAIQFSMYFSSLWPYLQQLDSTITESFFGYITAFYSLGQAIACPALGYWMNRLDGKATIPICFGLITMALGNFFYLLVAVLPYNVGYSMIIARFVTGVGGGVVAVVRTYAVAASTVKDRARAISFTTGAFALGLMVGPSLQLIFTPIGYPGWYIAGSFTINMYTAPAVMGVLLNLLGVTIMCKLFHESSVGIEKIEAHKEHRRFYALPKFDRIAVAICIASRFAQMFVITNLETIVPPYSMTIFSWTRREAVQYNSLNHGIFAVVGFIIYVFNVVFNIGNKFDKRIGCIIGLALLIAFHLITFPWPGLPGKIKYQEEMILVNGTPMPNPEPVGCRPSFTWCETVPPVNMYVYYVSYILLVGSAFPVLNIYMNTLYSTIIGPRNQGTMQGILLLSGSCARMVGPIFVAGLFTQYGPRAAWGIELVIAGFCIFLWIFYFNKMVPLKKPQSMSAGDSYRNKHGLVYKF